MQGGQRLAYRLTEEGNDLRGIWKAMRDLGLKWDKTTRALLKG